MFKAPRLPCQRVEKILSAASAQMSYPVALESEASQVFSLKESCPVGITQKYYHLCLKVGLMLGTTITVCQRQTVTAQLGPEASSVQGVQL